MLFFYALRDAANAKGFYRDAQTADRFWQSVADEINAACDDGLIPARKLRRSGFTAPFEWAYISPALVKTGTAIKNVFILADTDATPTYPEIDRGVAQKYEGVLHAPISYSYKNEHDKLFYVPDALPYGFTIIRGINSIYKIMIPVSLVAGAALFVTIILTQKKKKAAFDLPSRREMLLYGIIVVGLLFAFILRCMMIGYAETTGYPMLRPAQHISPRLTQP